MKAFLGCIGLMIFAMAILVASSILNGYVLTWYWEWFVKALFPGAPMIALVPAIGLAGMVRIIMGNYQQTPPPEKKKEDEKKENLPDWALAAISSVWRSRIERGKESNLPPSVMAAILAIANGKTAPKEEDKTEFSPWTEKIVNAVFITIFGPAFLLLIGWIIHSFM